MFFCRVIESVVTCCASLIKKCSSIVLLKVSPHPLIDGDVLIGGGGFDCHRLTFFYFFSLFPRKL